MSTEYPNLTQVWPSDQLQNDYEVEIIAVHGLSANPKTTWLSDGENRINWLSHEDMLPAKVPRARTWTFNFESNWLNKGPVQHIHYLGVQLIEFIHQKLRHDRPIIFVAHSFGGLVVAEALVSCVCTPRTSDILKLTTGTIFLGTPFHGSNGISAARIMVGVYDALGIPCSSTLLDNLKPGSPVLESLTKDFRRTVEDNEIDVVCFYEQVKQQVVKKKGLTRVYTTLLVPESSACLIPTGSRNYVMPNASRNYPLNAMHTKLNEFSNPNLGNYELVSGQILEVVMNTPRLMKRRRPALFHYPHEQSSRFTGREEILEKLIQAVKFGTGVQSRVGLHGLGGMGKTSIVTQYVHSNKEEFAKGRISTYFIFAGDAEKFSKSYLELAHFAGIPIVDDGSDKNQQITNWLQDPDCGRWIMIIDNADDSGTFNKDANLSQYIPRCDHGAVIITSRLRQVCTDLTGENSSDSLILVDRMTHKECHALLDKYSKFRAINKGYCREELIKELDYLPLALDKAAAFMNVQEITILQYLDLWQDPELRLELLDSDETGDAQDEAQQRATITWVISFNQIKIKDPNAANILAFMSFVNRQDIPAYILPRSSRSEVRFRKSLGTLKDYSMITESHGMFSLHALIQVATRSWLNRMGSAEAVMIEVLRSMVERFPKPLPDDWRLCWVVLPHARTALWHTEKLFPLDWNQPDICANEKRPMSWRDGNKYQQAKFLEGSLICKMSDFADTQGHFEESRMLRERGYYAALSSCGRWARITLDLLYGLGISYRETGYDLDESIRFHLELREYYEYECGKDTKLYISNLHQLAKTYTKKGMMKDADALMFEIFERSQKVLEPHDLDRIQIAKDWTLIKCKNGTKEEKIEGLKTLSEIVPQFDADEVLVKKSSGPLFVTLLWDMETLSEEIHKLEDDPKGLEGYNNGMLEGWKLIVMYCNEIYGSSHPKTLDAILAMVPVYEKTGDLKKAHKECAKVIEIRTRNLGESHPATQRSLEVLRKLGPRPLEWWEAGSQSLGQMLRLLNKLP